MYFSYSKREPTLGKRERMAHCQMAADSVVAAYNTKGRATSSAGDSSNKAKDNSRLLALTVETLLLMADDKQPDVWMTAGEALNKIVRVSKLAILI